MDVIAADRNKPTVVVALATHMDCQLLADVLERQFRLQVAACAITSASAISAVQDKRPDLVLISPRLEDGMYSGLQVAKALHASRTNSRIVTLIRSEDGKLVLESFRSGARGVLSVNDSPRDLCKCMAAVLRGDIWLSSTHLKHLVDALSETHAPVLLEFKNQRALTKGENEVLQLLAAGLTDQEIGTRLKMPENRIRKYLSVILQKVGLSSRAELALFFPCDWLRDEGEGSHMPEQKFGT